MSKIILGIKDDHRPMHVLGFEGNYSIENHWEDDPLGFHYHCRGTTKITLETNNDIIESNSTKEALNYIYGSRSGYLRELTTLSFLEKSLGTKRYSFEIKKVIFNGPATIVFFGDGKKEVVKQDPNSNEPFDPQKAILYAFMKHVSKASSSKLWDSNLKMVEGSLPLVESEDKQTKKSCNNCSKRQICAGFVFGDYWCWSPIKSEE